MHGSDLTYQPLTRPPQHLVHLLEAVVPAVVGVGDVEMVLVINDLFRALGIEAFSIRVNHRAVLNGMLEKQQLLL